MPRQRQVNVDLEDEAQWRDAGDRFRHGGDSRRRTALALGLQVDPDAGHACISKRCEFYHRSRWQVHHRDPTHHAGTELGRPVLEAAVVRAAHARLDENVAAPAEAGVERFQIIKGHLTRRVAVAIRRAGQQGTGSGARAW